MSLVQITEPHSKSQKARHTVSSTGEIAHTPDNGTLIQVDHRLTSSTHFDLSLFRPSRGIMQQVERAILSFGMIKPHDKIAVAFSGGKDSLLLISVFQQLSRRQDLDFTFEVIHLDQHQPGFARQSFDHLLEQIHTPCHIISKDTWSVVKSKRKAGQIPCAICGRLRRGILNRWCADHGFNKLALGHHLDDALETFMLNLLFGRRLDPLKPVTPTSDLQVDCIRPLLFVNENKIKAWLQQTQLQAIACPVCDTFPDSKRRDIKHILQSLSHSQEELYDSVRDAIYGKSSPLFRS